MGTSLVPSIFVQPSAVGQRMQIGMELEGTLEVLLSALSGAQLHIEMVLESKLLKQTWDAKYQLDSDAFSGIQPGGVYQLELPSGFVRTDSPLVVYVGTSWLMSDATIVPITDYAVDNIKGLLTLTQVAGTYNAITPNQSYDDKFIRVTGTSGFNSGDTSDLETTPPEVIPDWLQEAIISYCSVIFDTTQTTNRDGQAADIYKRAGDHAMAVIQPYMRKRGFVFRPISIA